MRLEAAPRRAKQQASGSCQPRARWATASDATLTFTAKLPLQGGVPDVFTPRKRWPGRFDFKLLAAADQDRHALRLQPGDQGPGRRRDYGKASACGTAHSRRIAVFP